MSIQEIVKYATSTPHNTNPAVLKSMLELEIQQNSSDNNPNFNNSVIGCVGGQVDKSVPTMKYEEVSEGIYYRVSDWVPDMYVGAVLQSFSGKVNEAIIIYFGFDYKMESDTMMGTSESGSFALTNGICAFANVPDGSPFLELTTATEGGLYIHESFLIYDLWAISYFKNPTG